MAHRHPHTGRPSALAQTLEFRVFAEMALLPWMWPLLSMAPHGDGHPVLLLPGFMGSEVSLVGLELYLKSRGYAVQTWGLGRNVGFHAKHANALEQKIRHMHHQSGQPVSLVGWSLGGVFALYGAHQAAACVRNVITLGSPVSVDAHGSSSPALVQALYRLVAHPMGPAAHSMQPRAKKLREREPLSMPLSCLYSLSDGVVPPQEATVDGNPALHENIRVPGSHVGLGFNAAVLWIVADRLAQPPGLWRPFSPAGPLGRVYRLLTHQALPV